MRRLYIDRPFFPEDVRETSSEQFGEALAINYENGPTVFVPLDDSLLLTLSRMVRSLAVGCARASTRDKKIRAWLRGLGKWKGTFSQQTRQ